MKKTLLLLLFTGISFAQTGILTPVDRLRIKTPQELSSNTQVMTRNASTGETGFALKSDLTDVLKYATAFAFPVTGVVGKFYYAIDNDNYFTWSGATYEAIGGTDNTKLAILNNLSDLNNVSTARTNLGLGTLATQSGTFADKYDASNPSGYQTYPNVVDVIADFIVDEPYDETIWDGVTDDAPSLNSVRDKFVSVDANIASKQNSLGFTPENVANKENTTLDTSTTKYPTNNLVKTVTDLKANLASPTFTGSVVVPNATLSTQAVNKGQLDSVNAKVSQYKTYFINTATGNNATGVYEDASKPFASIDYVNANFTIQDNDIFYLQGTGLTYLINNQLQAKKQTFIADSGSTNILDFSSNANTNAMVTGGSNNIVTIDMPNGVLRCERSGGTGVNFSAYTTSTTLNINVREIYWNTSTALAQSGGFICKVQADKISARVALLQYLSNDIIIKQFVCLASGANLGQYLKNVRINSISGVGSYMIQSEIDVKYIIGNVTATGGLLFNTGISEFDITFDNSTITSFALGATSTLKTLRGTIKSITSISGNINSTKFINFTANIGTGNMTLGTSNATVTFENSSIKSTNSPIIITAGAFSNVLEIKNSTFEVVNAVPLITGGSGGTNTVKIAGLSTNATVISDQSGTGVTVNVIGKQSVATAVSPNDAVTKAQLDAAVIGGGGATNLSATYAPTTVTVVNSSGTDATIKAVDGTDAGIVTVAQKSTWDGKQDALGFTPYNATNPSGYQTAGDVNSLVYDKIKNDPYGGAWAGDINGATREALYDKFQITSTEIADKQPLSSVLTATTASFTTADETKLDGIATNANVGVVPNAAITGATKTKITYDAKGLVTAGADANLNDLSDVNINTPTSNQVLVYDGLGEFRNGSLTTPSISDFNSATRAQTEAELVAGTNITITPSGTGATRQLTIASTGGSSTQSAFTVLANNTSSTATPTEQVFKCVAEQNYAGAGTITWGTSAPTTILANTYRWQQLGKFVTAQFNFSYNTAATNSQVTFTLPTDMPTPQTVSGFTGALDIICYGIGGMFSSTTAFPTTARVSFLRRNSANTGYEFLIVQSAGSSIKTAQLTITYEAL